MWVRSVEQNFPDFPVDVREGGGHYSAPCYGRLFGGIRGMGQNEFLGLVQALG